MNTEENDEISNQKEGFKNDDVRAYLGKTMKQTRIHGDQNNDVTFSIPKSEDDPIDKMRIVRNKMADSRRKEEQRIIQDALLIRK